MQNYFSKLIIISIFLTIIFSNRQASTAFNSAKTYARVEKNLKKAEEFGLSAYELDSTNALYTYFLATEVLIPLKKRDKAGEMFIKTLELQDTELEKPFRLGDNYIRTVHQSTRLYADDFYNYAIDSYNKKDIGKTESRFNIALQLDSKHLKSMLGLADLSYNNKQDIEQALKYINDALEVADDSNLMQITLTKVFYLRKAARFDEAINLLVQKEAQGLLGVKELRELFLTYLDSIEKNKENLDKAIKTGEELVSKMINDLEITEQSLISEASYNLAVSFRQRAIQNYNIIAEYLTSEENNANLNNEYIDLCKNIQEDLNQTTDYFLISITYDDKPTTSNETKNYRLEANELKKKVETLLLAKLLNE